MLATPGFFSVFVPANLAQSFFLFPHAAQVESQRSVGFPGRLIASDDDDDNLDLSDIRTGRLRTFLAN